MCVCVCNIKKLPEGLFAGETCISEGCSGVGVGKEDGVAGPTDTAGGMSFSSTGRPFWAFFSNSLRV